MLGSLTRFVMLRRAALGTAGVVALGLARREQAFASASGAAPTDAALGALWGEAIDGMINVPGCEELSHDGVLYLAPTKGAPPPVKWPKIIGKSVVYSLTGWNPMGKDAPHEQNLAANQRLQQDLAEWKGMNTRPRAWWHSFGFNEKEGWREDGFSVAFAPEERRFAKQCMQKLGYKYHQAAIYAYRVDKEGVLWREVVWVNPAHEHKNTEEAMTLLRKPPRSKLAGKV
jgi:hypothetical protein